MLQDNLVHNNAIPDTVMPIVRLNWRSKSVFQDRQTDNENFIQQFKMSSSIIRLNFAVCFKLVKPPTTVRCTIQSASPTCPHTIQCASLLHSVLSHTSVPITINPFKCYNLPHRVQRLSPPVSLVKPLQNYHYEICHDIKCRSPDSLHTKILCRSNHNVQGVWMPERLQSEGCSKYQMSLLIKNQSQAMLATLQVTHIPLIMKTVH